MIQQICSDDEDYSVAIPECLKNKEIKKPVNSSWTFTTEETEEEFNFDWLYNTNWDNNDE